MAEAPNPKPRAAPDLEVIDQVLERGELYVLAVIREGMSAGVAQPSGRSAATIAARRHLVDTIVKLAEEGRLG